jgi:hypothetical protein
MLGWSNSSSDLNNILQQQPHASPEADVAHKQIFKTPSNVSA